MSCFDKHVKPVWAEIVVCPLRYCSQGFLGSMPMRFASHARLDGPIDAAEHCQQHDVQLPSKQTCQ